MTLAEHSPLVSVAREDLGALPWTEEDAARLAGKFTTRDRSGVPRLVSPHVMTPSGAGWIGAVVLGQPDKRGDIAFRWGSECPHCGALKRHPRVRADDYQFFCFGCGVPS